MNPRSPFAARAARLLLLCGCLAAAGCTFLENEFMTLDRARPPAADGAPGPGHTAATVSRP